jgi:hypothetical protein
MISDCERARYRRTAGAAGFLSQCFDRPERFVEPSRLDTVPSQPSLQAC